MQYNDLVAMVLSLQDELRRMKEEKSLADRAMNRTLNNISARDAWQVSEEDNVDATHSLLIDLYIPPNGVTRHIQQVLLRVKLKAFRSYSAVTASGGSSTPTTSTEPQSVPTTSTEPQSSPTSSSVVVSTASVGGGGTTSGGNTWFSSPGYTSGFSVTSTDGAHTHGGAVSSDGGHTHAIVDVDHSHSIPDHSHTITNNAHEHTVTIAAHNHTVTIAAHNHTVTIPDHTHNITAAITTGATATGCTIVINGNDRTTALTGGATFAADQDELDVTQYMTATGYNTISITSSGLGRIRATVFVNLYLNSR